MRNNLLPLLLFLFSPFIVFSKNPLPVAPSVCDDVNNDNICDFSEFIHIDQFGYLEDADKVAVISDPQVGFNAGLSFTPSTTLEIREVVSDAIVFSGTIQVWNSGNTHVSSGDKGWWFDFSSLMTEGEYFVYDPIQEVRSMNFKINNSVYEEVMKTTLKMYYYNRCNATKATPYAESDWADGMNFMNNLQDGNCRYVNDQGNASLEKDLSGGWFDAGDYNKYVTFAHSVMHNLLWAYQENPSIFGDDWGIPESGNGIPDILDEVKWELDWLLKMTNADGSVHIKMGSLDHSTNVGSPPSVNTSPRYYGPTCTSASISNASVFAHAAKIFESFSATTSYANTLETNAINAWNYALPHLNNNTLETNCDNGAIVAGDADWDADRQKENAVGAAIYLYSLTGDNNYDSYIISHINETEQMQNDYWAGYRLAVNDALLHYTTLSNASAALAADIESSISTAATNNWEGFYGINNDDLYRAHMPNYSYHWGSSIPKAGFAILNLQCVKHNINTSSTTSYETRAAEQLHYFHGVNPLGLVQLSNMYDKGGDRCVNEIYHTWFNDGTDWDNALTSLYGPAPGFVTGGANKDFTVATISPPSGQPSQKSYLDFNDGYPSNSWEISEPSISYQAAYLRLLANYTDISTSPLPVDLVYFNVAITDKKQVKLTWKSATEINNDFYEIQRSQDGQHFEKLGRVDGIGTTNFSQVYTALDSTPLEGLSYYQIKQVDLDGHFEFFPIKSVFLETGNVTISLLPNPAKTQVQITLNSKINSKAQISILNLDGKTVFDFGKIKIRKGENQELINLEKLSSGMFFIKVLQENGEVILERLVKQ